MLWKYFRAIRVLKGGSSTSDSKYHFIKYKAYLIIIIDVDTLMERLWNMWLNVSRKTDLLYHSITIESSVY